MRYTEKYIPVLHITYSLIHFCNLITAIIKKEKERAPATILLRNHVLYPPLFELVFIPFYFKLFSLNPFLFITTVTSITSIPYYMLSTRSRTEPILVQEHFHINIF